MSTRTAEARATASQTPPFFLVGSERSGTTLLRLMLSHHPEIECAPEFEFLVEPLEDSNAWPDVEDYADWLETNRIFVPHELSIDESLSYSDLAKSFVQQYCERSGKRVHGATVHKHFDRLLRIWPQARFVHLIRDGRDVARSCIGMGWAGNVWHGAQRWIDAEELWLGMLSDVPSDNRMDLRYESLIENPERELSRICQFLGLTYDPGMLDYVQNSTYGMPDPALTQQWRRKLDIDQLQLLEARIGEMLRERGYGSSGVQAARVSAAKRVRLAIHDRWARFRFRSKRYGMFWLLADRFARTVGWHSMAVKCLLRRNEIDNRHIK